MACQLCLDIQGCVLLVGRAARIFVVVDTDLDLQHAKAEASICMQRSYLD